MSTWHKGMKSPNPGGRPKAESRAAAAMARLIREHAAVNDGAGLVEFAVRVWQGTEKEMDDAKSRRWAHDWLADRGFGKAQQHVEITTGDGEAAPLPDLRGLSTEELRRIAAGEGLPADDDPAGNVH
jgi:hypothetical protein